MVKEVNFEDVKRDVIHAFTNGCMCSESVITIANKHWDLGMGDDIMAIATGFPFGFGDGGNVCGAVAAATMSLGKVFGRVIPGDPSYEKCTSLVRELNDDVIAKFGSALCPDLLEGYEFATPVRKEHCTEIVVAVLESFARIMERECGVHVCW
ncbi:MAG: C-GCAxxG-C-C family protein [Mogibacterium diversum]|jgi:putative oxidoreductase|uniref:C_GCAxxG_C_C family protein n=1 Tax=Mogibacterium diversum TaxID=114527 RepID=A0A930HBM0_9FIRM|nr:C-GCAxxG-C-C family protein [Mogibacterium diversum]MBF1332416.1 C_GCAxxG_C_C family protein [Mogibacterium diversum]MBF1338154.1 C_GCAxxG_C_C family protein [Mogibacterium diversum]MBF1352224.1 C_GCAxxG_C_C family protein [Mogibacterium diversum]MBF1354785.1 C_GCAxxG_C_C family protein [Mogibacterium diversum]MBF1357775.1 C_GCAxxG_C_C family protein [Mogibacterium diversum]